MIRKILTVLFLATGLATFGQINMADSTVQVITYWDKGEKQNYTVNEEKIKLKGTDTTSIEKTNYDVEITVLKQTHKSYTVQWLYKNVKTNNTNSIIQKMMGVVENMKIIYKTDELGNFVEIENWKEVRSYIQKATDALKKEFKAIPEIDKIITQVAKTNSTKDAIESTPIKEIQQFHNFHGVKYKLGKVIEGQIEGVLYGTEPVDCDTTVCLDEINEEDNYFIIRSTQKMNKEQLANAAFNYMKILTKDTKIDLLKREDLKDSKSEVSTVSQISGTGWVIYSVQTAIATIDDTTSIVKREIKIQ